MRRGELENRAESVNSLRWKPTAAMRDKSTKTVDEGCPDSDAIHIGILCHKRTLRGVKIVDHRPVAWHPKGRIRMKAFEAFASLTGINASELDLILNSLIQPVHSWRLEKAKRN